MKRIFIDTNIWLRYFVQDYKPHNKKSREIVKKIERGEYHAITSVLVIAEVVWTLSSFYEVSKSEVVKHVESILTMPNLEIDGKSKLQKTVELFAINNVDFIDCYNFVISQKEGVEDIATFDEDWDQFEGINRIP